jgi:thioredoxin-dependent peroxiredoxin
MFLRMLKALLAGSALMLASQASYALQVGDKAPDFSLPSTSGTNVKLSDFAGKQSVVIFTYFAAYTKT